ncbi:hypothetical protein [Niabella aquatica]
MTWEWNLYTGDVCNNAGANIAAIKATVVHGKIRAKEIKVETANWPDYVFDSSYKLRSLYNVESSIKANGYWPEVLSAKEVEKNGLELGASQTILLKKIEELTLHLIEVKKEKQNLKQRIEKLEAKK